MISNGYLRLVHKIYERLLDLSKSPQCGWQESAEKKNKPKTGQIFVSNEIAQVPSKAKVEAPRLGRFRGEMESV